MTEGKKKTGGGAATNAGIDYQGSVAAWYMCKLLVESGTTLPYDLPSHDKFTQIDFETGEPTDDINIKTYLGSNIYIQAKRSLSLGASKDSALAKSLDQFVKQYIKAKAAETYDPKQKRYILAYDTSPQTVDNAAQALTKFRAGTPFDRLPETEKNAFSVIKEHIKRLYKDESGAEPSEDEANEILSSLYLHKLKVLDNDSDAQSAQDILRNIITTQSQAPLAWNTLRIDAVSFGRQRGSINLDSLVSQLHSKGIRLRTSVDYSSDIAKLKAYTQDITLPILERSSSVRVDGKDIKLERMPLLVMKNLTTKGKSFLVTGEPGAGKSGVLYELVKSLQDEGRDVLAIAAEQISSSSFGDIQKEFNLDNSLNDVLMNWRGSEKGAIIIDALDAARNPEALRLFMDIANQIINERSRWSVVISIRKYDLRYNETLKSMFPREQLSEFVDPEFSTAHINIPLLSDIEQDSFVSQSPKLHTLVQKAGLRMRELLRSPFNIKIAAEIMDSGVDAEELTEIDTQIGLLDRYWSVRVIDGGAAGTTRSTLISSISNNMVETQSLKVPKLEITKQNPTSIDQLETLLSRSVLSEESQGDFLSFSHHIIYDYAVYRTMLRASPGGIKDLLEGRPYFALSVRPSIYMYWQYRWHSDPTRQKFWSEVLSIEQNSSISRLAKSISIQIATESIRTPEDITPLIDHIKHADQSIVDVALSVFKRCSDIMTATKRRGEPDNAEVWIPAISEVLNLKDDYPTRVASCSILESAIEEWPKLSSERKNLAGSASRKLLEVETEKDPPHKWVMRLAIKLVAETYETSPVDSYRVLNALLEDTMISNYGYMYLGDVADHVGKLAVQNDELVYRIYETAFTYDEKSDEITSMGNSQILGLNSNRRQDYNMVHWQLGQKYNEVAAANLTLGLKALNIALIASADSHGVDESAKTITKTFPYFDSEQSIEKSRAYVWSLGLQTGSKGHEIYQAFKQHMDKLSSVANGANTFRNSIEQNAGIVKSPHFWVLILTIGTEHPKTLGVALTPLLTALPLLQSPEISGKLGEFIVSMYPTLDQKSRQEVEKFLLSASKQPGSKYEKQQSLATLEAVFKNVDEKQLITSEAKAIHKKQVQDKANEHENPIRSGWLEDDEDYFERGQSEEDKALLRLVRKEEMAINNLQPSEISTKKIAELLEFIKKLEGAVQVNSTASDSSKREVKRLISKTYEMLCRSPEFKPSSDNWEIVSEKILGIINEKVKTTEDAGETDVDEAHEMLSDYGPRSVAVEALMVITNKETDTTRLIKLRNLIRDLSSDESTTVRYMVASHINYLWQKADSDFVWEMVNKIKDNETNSEIVHHLSASLSYLRRVAPDQTYQALAAIYRKWQKSTNEKLRETTFQQIAEAYVIYNNQNAKQLLDEVLEKPIEYSPELTQVEGHLRGFLTHGIDKPDDTDLAGIRARARSLLIEILGSFDEDEEYKNWAKKHEGKKQSELTKEEIKEIRSILGHTENIAEQIYFASGSFDEKNNKEGKLSDTAKKVFITEQEELIAKIISTGRVSSAHHFVEMALVYIDTDPIWALKLVEQFITTSAPKGSTNESLMAGSVTTFIQKFISSHREHLKDPENQQLLINILDGFVETGWPEAINLMDDLEEIFR